MPMSAQNTDPIVVTGMGVVSPLGTGVETNWSRLILTGEADVAIVGGAEGSIDPISVGGFGAARALATAFNDDPASASRPFDRKRDGFVLAEGAAVLVIERLSHAKARGATPL
ncbi:MAG: hypothetical protein EOP19_23720, partial [Hyphomicrobiales bacterium]